MQRTVKGTKVNLVEVEIINGEVVNNLKSVVYANTPVEKAIKKAKKEYTNCAVVSTEPHEQLYILDDEIFFKYAVAVDNKAGEGEEA